eukprot:scaffold22379_cov145-Isochrysis_galbana.AAC.6
MAKRKAAGPDKLPAEFYHSFENLILDRFHDMILEACAKGELPEGLTCGDIIVLYKKGPLVVSRVVAVWKFQTRAPSRWGFRGRVPKASTVL